MMTVNEVSKLTGVSIASPVIACKDFPCDTIIIKPHSSVLDKDWLTWKKKSESNR